MGTLTVDNLNTSTIIGSAAPLITSATPSFFAYLSSTQTLTNNSRQKINCNTEVYDSAGASSASGCGAGVKTPVSGFNEPGPYFSFNSSTNFLSVSWLSV